jgi:phospholipid/cholesterol/gamma-HCH transport system substrate-binding protein
MVFGKSKLELRVGVFVFGGLFILTTFVLLIGKYQTWTAGYRVNFLFNFVNGVKLGAPVRFAGVDVGEVKEIKCEFLPQDNKTIVKVNCWLKNDIKIPLDSSVWVNTLGLLGEKYIEVMPGKDYTNLLTVDQDLKGVDPVPMQGVTELARKIAGNLDDIISKIRNKEGTLGKLLFNDAIYNDLEALTSDLRKNPWKLFYKSKEVK